MKNLASIVGRRINSLHNRRFGGVEREAWFSYGITGIHVHLSRSALMYPAWRLCIMLRALPY